jgi:putative membrane protein
VEPRIAVLDAAAGRLEAPEERPAPPARAGTAGLAALGVAVLVLGLGALGIGNFVADQFARAAWLGWMTLGVSGLGAGLVGVGVGRELRALARLAGVERLRGRLADPATRRAAALEWLAGLPGEAALAQAVRAANDPDAILALLQAGPGQRLRREAEGLGMQAAIGVFALTAAMPSPALDVAAVAWRGVRLIRQVAELHGMRPGALGTLGLVRRTLAAASLVGVANVAVDTALRAALSQPALARLAGDAAGAAVAARRMVVLARAAAAACSPLPMD